MRHFLLLFLVLACSNVFAQWDQVFPFPTDPLDVSVADDSTVYTLCSSWSESTLYKSKDGARTWKKANSAPSQLSRIFFVDGLTGFGVSGNAVYKTTDGAASWTSAALPGFITVSAIQFTSPQVGYIATSGQGILKSLDGGLTWNFVPGSPSMSLYHSNSPLSFVNDQIGYVVDESGLFRTEDGGSTWTAIDMFRARNVFAATEDIVYVSTDYETKKSIDRGHSWMGHYYTNSLPVYAPGKNGLLFVDYSTILQADTEDANFNSVYRSDFTFSWKRVSMGDSLILAIGNDRAVVRSQDSGKTWALISSTPQHGEFRDVHFTNEKEGFIIGPDRGFVITNNNGASWQYAESLLRDDLNQLAFCHPDTGIVVLTNNYAMTTHDGGKTFDASTWNPPIVGHQSSKDYEMVNAKIIYTTGAKGKIAKSVNGGTSWETTSFDFSNTLYSIYCLNRDTCHAAGAVGKIVSTWNGGATWTVQNDIPANQDLVEIYMLNPLVGFASGNNVIVRTKDGGHNWSVMNVPGGAVTSFLFTSVDTGYAVTYRGYVLRTTDQGATWRVVYAPQSFSHEVRKAFLRDSTIFAITPSAVFNMHLATLNVNPEPNPDPDPVLSAERRSEMVSIHPNPTDGLVHISAPEPVIAVEIRSVRGNLVRRFEDITSSLDIYDLPPGLYIVHVLGKSKSWTWKIIKK